MPTALNRALQAKADLQRSNDARDTLEQAVEEMKRELTAAASSSVERSVLQDEVAAFSANQFSRHLTRLRIPKLHKAARRDSAAQELRK